MRFEVAPFSLSCRITENGSLLVLDTAAETDARCVIPPSLLPRLAVQDESALAGIGSEGDSELLAEIFFLSRNLRWDAAEVLSRVTGDIAAERLVASAQNVGLMLRESAENLFKAGAEYLTEERPLLAKPGQLSTFMLQVDNLRDDLARLEQRIDRLAAAKED
ncbi:MAG: hypothetical protein WCA64_01105 [Gallionella sp.]